MHADASKLKSAYADREVTKAPPWHGLVVWDVLFNGLATGLFLVAGLGELTSPGVFGKVAQIAYPIALVLLTIDLVCLVLDLGDPLRFHHMLRVFKPTSPMSLGTWSLTIFSLPLTGLVIVDLLGTFWPVPVILHRSFVALGVMPALASAIYKGVLFSTGSQPGWKDARWLGGYLTASALVLGCAEMLVIALIIKEERAIATLRPALGMLLVLLVIPLILLGMDLRTELSRSRKHLTRTIAVGLVAGVLLPALLLLVSGGALALACAALLILLGAYATRALIVALPHASA